MKNQMKALTCLPKHGGFVSQGTESPNSMAPPDQVLHLH